MNLRMLARYPFIPEAREYLKNLSLQELLTSDEYEESRTLGFQRLRSSLTGEKVNFPSPRGDYALRTIFLSFVVAKLILIALGDPLVVRRFANVERDRVERSLEDVPDDVETVAEALNLRFRSSPGNREYSIHFVDFIKYAKNFSSEDFRLVRQKVKGGWLPIDRERFIKILREAFVDSFIEDVKSQENKRDALLPYFKREVDEIKMLKDEYLSSYSSTELGEVDAGAFPPCMKTIITKIKEGVNVSHEARFSMVAFLHQIGMSNDDILKIFATVPDFRKDLTMYQIRHITGEISGKEYKVPKCTTMRSFGLCVRDVAKDKLCYKPWMSHPLLYYKIKKEKSKKAPPRSKQNAEQR